MSIQLTNLLILASITTNIVFGAPATSVSDSNHNLITELIDTKYPITKPIKFLDGSVKYRIAIIADLDRNSVSPDEPDTWISYFKEGHLTYKPSDEKISIEWDDFESNGDRLKTNLSVNGRGAELSELVTYNSKLITLDDKTGYLYLIQNKILEPWVKVLAGNGQKDEGMKNEWATVKDSKLYVGSHGNGGVNSTLNWVKTIDKSENVHHLDWTENYQKVLAAMNKDSRGYMTHEAVEWSDVHSRWFFLPRKASVEPFDYSTDQYKGTNVLLSASPNFNDIKSCYADPNILSPSCPPKPIITSLQDDSCTIRDAFDKSEDQILAKVVYIGEPIPNHGYSSFKFIPETNHTVITAISTQEENGVTATFITAFTIEGKILFPETKVSDLKFEGFEFI